MTDRCNWPNWCWLAVKTTAAARPGNLDAQRDVSVSLDNVARMLEGTDPGAALDLYQQSLTIRPRDVAAARPGNLDAQRERVGLAGQRGPDAAGHRPGGRPGPVPAVPDHRPGPWPLPAPATSTPNATCRSR